MTDPKLQGKFNERDTFIAQMSEADQQRLQQLQKQEEAERRRIEDRQKETRDANIERKQKALEKQQEQRKHEPAPPTGAVKGNTKRITPEDIREKAVEMVRAGEVKEMDNHKRAFDLAEKKLIEKSLQREVSYQKDAPRSR